jgi:hypothetical protein
VIPPLTPTTVHAATTYFGLEVTNALDAIISLKTDIADAHDALLATKVSQANSANKHRDLDTCFAINDLVYLSMAHRRRDYLNGHS